MLLKSSSNLKMLKVTFVLFAYFRLQLLKFLKAVQKNFSAIEIMLVSKENPKRLTTAKGMLTLQLLKPELSAL